MKCSSSSSPVSMVIYSKNPFHLIYSNPPFTYWASQKMLSLSLFSSHSLHTSQAVLPSTIISLPCFQPSLPQHYCLQTLKYKFLVDYIYLKMPTDMTHHLSLRTPFDLHVISPTHCKTRNLAFIYIYPSLLTQYQISL